MSIACLSFSQGKGNLVFGVGYVLGSELGFLAVKGFVLLELGVLGE